MHGVVLMLALTTATDAPACHRGGRGGCHGGCQGGYTSGCYGGGYGGGCYGGYAGACYGGGCYGGGYMVGGYSYSKFQDETDEEFKYCQEQASKMSSEAYMTFREGLWKNLSHAQRKAMMEGAKKPGSDKDKEESSSLGSRARLIVTLPADAKLLIDDETTRSVGSQRQFVSPPLPTDGAYEYTLKAEFVKDGKTVAVTKKVNVVRGTETVVTFDEATQPGIAGR
jgi:uncharacterized protein (TIGR03000 family)